jgi:hypothetical protein
MTQKTVAPPAEVDAPLPPRVQRVVDLVAEVLANRIRREANTEDQAS